MLIPSFVMAHVEQYERQLCRISDTLRAGQNLAIGDIAVHIYDENRRFAMWLRSLFHFIGAIYPIAI